MTGPYWSDGQVTLYVGDCREVTEWLGADVLVTDPPYGRDWRGTSYNGGRAQRGIEGDKGTETRDRALTAWGDRPAFVFGDLLMPPPRGTKGVLIYAKPPDAGFMGVVNGFRRDAEAVYLLGPWPVKPAALSCILRTGARSGPSLLAGRYGHPHAKPVDVMETLIGACPAGTIADPFAGSGSTLVAARNLGRQAVGVEVDERYAERAARRLAQMVMVTA